LINSTVALVAFARLSSRQLDRFRYVPLEVQPERAAVGKGGNLPLKIPSERGFSGQ